MATRSIATLSISFGLVSIPVRLYSATESASAIRFRLMTPGGARVRQTYVTDALPTGDGDDDGDVAAPMRPAPTPAPTEAAAPAEASGRRRATAVVEPEPEPEPDAPVERRAMLKGYEFEKGRFVLFSDAELKALQAESRQTIDIVSFIPNDAVDPIHYDKPYFLAPDRRGAKPYSLLLRAMQDTGRCALAKWAWRAKEYVVQIRPTAGGLVLQQLLYADEVRDIGALDIELAPVSEPELKLARQMIAQLSADRYDATAFVDEEKQRILDAVERKIAGQEVVRHGAAARDAVAGGAEVVDLMAALRASLALPELRPNGRKPAKRSGTAREAPPVPATTAMPRAARTSRRG